MSTSRSRSIGSSGDKRRRQVLQAQRKHRHQNQEYIVELESEVLRLRAAHDNVTAELNELKRRIEAKDDIQKSRRLSAQILTECCNGQVAPGLFMNVQADPKTGITRHSAGLESRLNIMTNNEPERSNQSNISRPVSNGVMILDNCLKAAFVSMMENQVGISNKISPSLELFDSSTRMLLSNFSEDIAPTMVPIDGPRNGFRTILLPLACEHELVRYALLASSANHLRLKKPELAPAATRYQTAAIASLTGAANITQGQIHTGATTLATIVLLLVNDMVTGCHDFRLLIGMAKSWILAFGDAQNPEDEPVVRFLKEQINFMELMIEPLIGIRAPSFLRGDFQPLDIFTRLESAIDQACKIYALRVLGGPPQGNDLSVAGLLDKLKATVEEIPIGIPGEHALIWVYFLTAAESSSTVHREFFAGRLAGVYERVKSSNIAKTFNILHSIWEQ